MDFDALDPATPGDFESDPVMRRRTLLIGLPAMAAGGAVVAPGGDWLRRKDEVTEIGPASALVLPGKQVWGHMIAHGLPDYELPENPYGTTRPLDMTAGPWTPRPRSTGGVTRALASGLTGMQILLFDGLDRGDNFMVEWFTMADPTWVDPSRADFSVAPCILPSSPTGTARMIREYAAAAKDRPSAGRIGSALVIYVYDSRKLSPAQWTEVRRASQEAGIEVFLIGSLNLSASQTNYRVSAASLDTDRDCMDAYWLFDDSASHVWSELLPMLASRQMPFAGGIQPGYSRETEDNGGYVSPRGTKQFRAQWEEHLTAGLPWANIATWNDVVERSDIKASSDWSTTRQDINAYYSARFRGVALPQTTPQLYMTTPDFIVAGKPVEAEALVINSGPTTVSVGVRILGADGQQLGPVTVSTIKAGGIGEATTRAMDLIEASHADRHVRAESTLYDHDGTPMQRVVSAPILVYRNTVGVTPRMRQHFYSVPAYKWLQDKVSLTFSGNPAHGSVQASVSVVGNARKLRQVEVIQNTRALGARLEVVSATFAAPMTAHKIVGGEIAQVSAAGFYVARVIDESERVAYSDPVYFA